MDNKETLKQNNSRIDINNADLASILITINNLPKYEKVILQEKNITPNTETQEIVADVGYTGLSKVNVDGDSDLLPENIKKGVNIFGVDGEASVADFEINNCSYLFYGRARLNYKDNLLALCKNVTNMDAMFSNCDNLTTLDLSNFDTSNVTTMENMFYLCSKLTTLDLSNFDTSNVTTMRQMFCNCGKLTSLDLSNFDMSRIIKVTNMFYYSHAIENIKSFKNLGKGYTKKTNNHSEYSIDFSWSSGVNRNSLVDIITNGLYDLNLTYDVANGGTLYTQKLVLGSKHLAKLTAEEIAIATNKGWVVS